jgi:predicted HicB family RNase H-like nuclease
MATTTKAAKPATVKVSVFLDEKVHEAAVIAAHDARISLTKWIAATVGGRIEFERLERKAAPKRPHNKYTT